MAPVLRSLAVAVVALSGAAMASPTGANLDNLVVPSLEESPSNLQWEVEIRPGEMVSLNGTVQQVWVQALELNPAMKIDMAERIAKQEAEFNAAVAEHEAKEATLQKRDHTECYYRPPGPFVDQSETNLRYLYGLPGRPTIHRGQKDERIACQWGSGIFWGTDGDSWTASSWGWVANAANIVVKECARSYSAAQGPRAGGRRYHDSLVYVRVGNANC